MLALNVREDARSQKRSPQPFDTPPRLESHALRNLKAGHDTPAQRLGLLTVGDALAEIERRRVKAVETPASLHRGRDVALYPKR